MSLLRIAGLESMAGNQIYQPPRGMHAFVAPAAFCFAHGAKTPAPQDPRSLIAFQAGDDLGLGPHPVVIREMRAVAELEY
jgi:hypothetical protein